MQRGSLQLDLMVWPPTQLINFYFVRTQCFYRHLRLSFIACTAALSRFLRVRRAADLQCGH